MFRRSIVYGLAWSLTQLGIFSGIVQPAVAGDPASKTETSAASDAETKPDEKPLGIDPAHAVAAYNRGLAKKNKGDFDGAIQDYNEALRLVPNYTNAFNRRGQAKEAKGDYDGAIQDFAQAIRLDPGFASAFNNRAVSKEHKEDYAGAIRDYDEAIRLDPKDALFWKNRGYSKSKNGDVDGALRDYDEAIRLNPKFGSSFNNRGNVKALNGDLAGAIRDYDEAIRLNPKDVIPLSGRGTARSAAGDFAAAIQDFEAALRLDPKDMISKNKLAFLLATCADVKRRDAAAALRLADQVLQSKEKDVNAQKAYALNAKACALALQGQYEEAIILEEEALKDEKYAKGKTASGGVFAVERIAQWKNQKLWFAPVKEK